MYNTFFGFREKPFKLVPNPAYLFLSRSHEEALAHLNYAVSQGDGFVEITGEVGTGKTTLCRAFLDNLDDDVSAAYIFNPRLDARQLLQAIGDEFGIASTSGAIKDLIDALNAFLMAQKADGRRVLLLIDEAQNLSREVLEQLRLLSNLETNQEKLLQIILVGQPELGDLLESYDLRQIGQRITLNCHLLPLSRSETREYIHHRLHIAARRAGVPFTAAAVRAIYRYSSGVPRLVNIACDRILLLAFSRDQQRITGGLARTAIRELKQPQRLRRRPGRLWPAVGVGGVLGALAVVVALVVLSGPFEQALRWSRPAPPPGTARDATVSAAAPDAIVPEPTVTEEPEPPVATPPAAPVVALPATAQAAPPEVTATSPASGAAAAAPGEASEPVAAVHLDLTRPAPAAEEPVLHDAADFLNTLDRRISRNAALRRVLSHWRNGARVAPGLAVMDDDEASLRLAAQQAGLTLQRLDYDLDLLRHLNLPAIVKCRAPATGGTVYLAVEAVHDGGLLLRGGSQDARLSTTGEVLDALCTSPSYVLWKNFYAYRGVIPVNAPDDAVMTLKLHLREIGFSELAVTSRYDAATRRIVEQIQTQNGLKADGFVGPLTQIVLYNATEGLAIPHLAETARP
jgi:general secretion pathway protein A